jgi:glycosyltransferase involved in cell wall biosynthesis
MARRRAQLASGPLQKTYLNSEARKLARLETRVCPQCNVNLTVSADDAELLRQNNPAVHAHVVENGTDTEFFHPLPVEEEPNTIVFAGSLNWYPNLSALEYFRREVWQLLKRESPRIRFYVAGMRPPEWLAKWAAADSRVTLVADPDDIRPWIARAAVCICPILDGGGTRLKILDAMAMGKAMVSTRFASEGLRVQEGKELLLAATAEEFAAHVLCLLRDDRARSRMATAARSLVEREYSWQRIGEQLQAAYRCALGEGCGEPARMRAHANVEA